MIIWRKSERSIKESKHMLIRHLRGSHGPQKILSFSCMAITAKGDGRMGGEGGKRKINAAFSTASPHARELCSYFC